MQLNSQPLVSWEFINERMEVQIPSRLWDLRMTFFLMLVVIGLFLLTLLIPSLRGGRDAAVARTTSSGLKRPPTLPFAVPFLGHLFQFLWDGHSLMSNAAKYFGRTVPCRIILPIFSNYVISGPDHVSAYLKEVRELSTTSRGLTVIENAFGCPSHLVGAFKPHTPAIELQTNSKERSKDNLDHIIHGALVSGLSGVPLDALTARFQENLAKQIEEESQSSIGDDWVEFPDLVAYLEKHVFEAAVRSMFGTYMLSLNPTLVEDFWNFSHFIGALFMGVPRWLNPAAYRARQKMLENIKRWQTYTREHCDIESLGDVEWEPHYGSKYLRERQSLLTKRGILDETARGAENLAFLWATNCNSIPAAAWLLIETLQDSSLEARVRASLPALMSSTEDNQSKSVSVFDITKLCSDPLLQSMYAETLRLRVAALLVREPVRDNFSFRGWHIKKEEVMSVSTRTEAMNDEIWSTGGEGDPHPLDTFWADRFLVDPDNPSSGPLKFPKQKKTKKPVNSQSNETTSTGKAEFSMDGLAASWIPYGGGISLCPGRHFAKREIIATTAILLSAYDMELIHEEGKKRPEVDLRSFGFGTMPPNRKMPCRIRRRRAREVHA